MKKQTLTLAAITAIAALSFPAQAKLLEVKAGIDAWYSDAKVNNVKANDSSFKPSMYVAVEHFIPLIPNVKLRYTDVKASSLNLDINQYDLIAYYEILDSKTLSFDLGINLQNFDGNFSRTQTINKWQPNLYGSVALGIPTTPMSIYSTLSIGEFDSTSTVDGEVGVQFTTGFILDVGLKAGYRVQDYDFNLPTAGKVYNRGFFAGVELAF